MARNELKHWGIKGMKWGVRKKSSAPSDGSSNTSSGHSSNAPRQNLSRNQRRQQTINRARNQPYRKVNKLDKRFTFKNVVAGLAVGAAGMVITRLTAPTVDIAGKKIASSVSRAGKEAAVKRAARKHFAEDAAEFARRRAAAQAANTAGNLAKEKFAPW